MKSPSIFRRRREDINITMTPMIDVVFLLLVFFVWTTSFHVVEFLLPSELSAVSGTNETQSDTTPPPEMDFDNLVVRITHQGNSPAWSLNGEAVPSLERLRATLARISEIKQDAPVIIHPEKNVPLGDVIDVFDLARLQGFDQVQFATSEKI